MGDVTLLLRQARNNDRTAIDEVVALLYPELHRLARARLAQSSTITLLDATSMVHEVFLRLHGSERIEADCRGQFMAYAAQVMRSVIIDCVRQRRAERRGGLAAHVTLSTDLIDRHANSDDDLERINEALDELQRTDPRLKTVVEMRYFAGFSEREIGAALGVTERTVRRDWERARLLLSVALKK